MNCSFFDFVSRMKEGKKSVICYGAGMLPLYIEPLLSEYDLLSHIGLFIDGSPQKAGKVVPFQGKSVKIAMPDRLKTLDPKHNILLFTAEKYEEILTRIRNEIDLSCWECYAYPLLNLSYFKRIPHEKLVCGKKSCIPKVIHYTWFGGGKKGELHAKCIESWKKQCPDYEIMEWNETNYDIHKNRYMEQAYGREKWAYVSDYARLDILYQYGGIYLDTDVELLECMDALLTMEAFVCFGEWPVPNSGSGIGCSKGNPIIKEMMDTREALDFIQEDGSDDPHTNSNYEMQVLMRHGFRMDFACQTKDGMTLYPPDVIAPVSVTGRDAFITERTIGIHYCNNSWRSGISSRKDGEKNGRTDKYRDTCI